jgi:hypothetical protein
MIELDRSQSQLADDRDETVYAAWTGISTWRPRALQTQGVGKTVRVQGEAQELKARGSRLRVQGSGFKVQGSWFKVHGSWFKVHGSWFEGFKGSTARALNLEPLEP